MSARITFFNTQYAPICDGGWWNTSKSSIVAGIGVSFSSDSGGRKGIVGKPFPQMPNLFRIRRNGFERIKVTQYFVVVVVVLYVQCIYGPIWSCVGSFRYGSVVCCTSTDNNKSFLILVMAESFTCLFS